MAEGGSSVVSSYKSPPAWNEGIDFETWRNEVAIWEAVTDLATGKQGPAVALTLTGSKRETATSIPIDELKVNDGLKKLLDKLKTVFGKETVVELFADYERFEILTRNDKSMTEYISEFEKANTRLKHHSIDIPDQLLACKLLFCARLDERDKKLMLTATPDLKYDSINTNLKRVFASTPSSSCISQNMTIVKNEAVFAANTETVLWNSRGRNKSSNFRGKGPPNRGNIQGGTKKQNGTNPVRRDGQVTTCAVCGSRFHWVKDCPDKDPDTALITDQEADEKTSFLTFVMISGTLFDESKGKAVLDSCCTATVAGEQWLNDYLHTLPQERTIEIKREEVNTFVVFGGGEKVRVKYSITIPVQICCTSCQITLFILPGSLPLLLSSIHA